MDTPRDHLLNQLFVDHCQIKSLGRTLNPETEEKTERLRGAMLVKILVLESIPSLPATEGL